MLILCVRELLRVQAYKMFGWLERVVFTVDLMCVKCTWCPSFDFPLCTMPLNIYQHSSILAEDFPATFVCANMVYPGHIHYHKGPVNLRSYTRFSQSKILLTWMIWGTLMLGKSPIVSHTETDRNSSTPSLEQCNPLLLLHLMRLRLVHQGFPFHSPPDLRDLRGTLRQGCNSHGQHMGVS